MVRILVVEDEALVALQTVEDIEAMGHKVVGTADSAEQVLDMLIREPVDIVLMDILIQGDRNGIELARLINDLYPASAIIFMTAHTDPATVEGMNSTRYRGILNKPFTEMELIEIINPAG